MSQPAFLPRLRSTSYVVIPARLASTRLPRKMLLRETGKTLLEHTYQAARGARRPTEVIIAADSEEIATEVRRFGGQCRLTSPELATGTDRIAAVARELEDADILVNLQGDEPEMASRTIDQVIGLLEDDPSAMMATLATPIRRREQLENPSCVKVVFDAQGRALYFSRSPIPRAREWSDDLLRADPPCFFLHLGLYAYRREFLLKYSEMPPGRLEQLEKLEQLRVLEAGHSILVGVADHQSAGIDTPDDYRAFVERMRAG